MKLVVNRYEELTYKTLHELTEEFGARVFAKTRVADVLPVNGSGLTGEDFSYALKSHFDFTVVDQNLEALFAVEFDGPSHRDSAQKARDQKKNALCERFGFPLLRVKANYLDLKFRGMDLLTYFVEAWFMTRIFDEAQERGDIDPNEYWDPQMLVYNPKRKEQFPYWISLDLQIKLERLAERKAIHDHIVRHNIVLDNEGNYRCLAWLDFTESSYIIVETGMRAHQFPISIAHLVSQIAICEVWAKLERVMKGELKAEGKDALLQYLVKFGSWETVSSLR